MGGGVKAAGTALHFLTTSARISPMSVFVPGCFKLNSADNGMAGGRVATPVEGARVYEYPCLSGKPPPQRNCFPSFFPLNVFPTLCPLASISSRAYLSGSGGNQRIVSFVVVP